MARKPGTKGHPGLSKIYWKRIRSAYDEGYNDGLGKGMFQANKASKKLEAERRVRGSIGRKLSKEMNLKEIGIRTALAKGRIQGVGATGLISLAILLFTLLN